MRYAVGRAKHTAGRKIYENRYRRPFASVLRRHRTPDVQTCLRSGRQRTCRFSLHLRSSPSAPYISATSCGIVGSPYLYGDTASFTTSVSRSAPALPMFACPRPAVRSILCGVPHFWKKRSAPRTCRSAPPCAVKPGRLKHNTPTRICSALRHASRDSA